MLRNLLISTFFVVIWHICPIYSQNYTHQHSALPQVNKKFSIVVHVFADSLGAYNVTEQTVKDNIQNANSYFKPIAVSFEVCEFRYHPNYEHNNLNNLDELEAIKTKYHANNRINIYLVAQLIDPQEPGFASDTIGPIAGSGIFFSKIFKSFDFAHQMGHYCGLLHTFEGNGFELVGGANCATAGDRICDTPADPYTPGEDIRNYIGGQGSCRFIYPFPDALGEFYNPDLGNIMALYGCGTCGFTSQQLQKIAATILRSGMRLW
jgi:Pregnancy-associated plasma protein-A